MKKLLLFLFAAGLFIKGMAQSSNRISGRITDSTTGNGLPFVTVHLLKDTSIIKSTFSDGTANYHFSSITQGNYFLSFSIAGYTNFISDSFFINDDSRLNIDIKLSADAKQLSQVTVFSKKPLIEKSSDGIIYNVQQDLLAGGGTAVDVLRKTPLVSVGQDGTPSIRGSSNIRVYIDNKPSDIYAPTVTDALRQIPAEEIVKVEVILYPSSKYDAEGTDGVINIITRRKKLNGTNGTINTNIGHRYQNLVSSITIRQQKWIFSIDAGGYAYHNKNSAVMTRRETNEHFLLQQNSWKNKGKTFYSGINIIYEIDSLKTIYGGYRYRTNGGSNDRISLNEYRIEDSVADRFQRNSFTRTGNTVNSINAGYSSQSKNKRSELKLFISWFGMNGYNNYNLEQFREANTDYKENFTSSINNAELSLQADYTHKISPTANFEAGAKTMNRQTKSANNFETYEFSLQKFIDDNTRKNDFDYRRNIYAAYSNVNLTFKTWQVRIGARYEQTLLKANFKDTSLGIPDYKNFIPSVLINKSIGEKQALKWSYTKQLLRPYIVYLNPAINYNDSLNLEFGNPYLLPEITHRYDMGYTVNLKKVFIGATLFYTHNHNSIENIRIPGDNAVFYSTYANIGKKDAAGFSGNLSWRGSKITASTNLTLRYMMLNSAALQLVHNGLQFTGNFNLSWKFKNGYSAEGFAAINSKDIRLQGGREGWKYFTLSFNKKSNNEKLTLSLRTEYFNRYITEYFENTTFYQQTDTKYQNFFVSIGLSWKFGRKEIKVPVTQQASSD